jgi:hypothetical protein
VVAPRPLYPLGSEWRKWDLQVHTPYSALHNSFGEDLDLWARELISRAVGKGIAAVGVTDYFVIDGYRHLWTLLRDDARLVALVGRDLAQRARSILFVPNIEFRLSVVVRDSAGHDSRVNFHAIFADDLEPDDIDEHFLRELKFVAEAAPDVPDNQHSLTAANLAALGARLKGEQAEFRDLSDLRVGMMNAVVEAEDISKALERQSTRFGDRYLLVLPADEDLSRVRWGDQGHLVRKLLVQRANMFFSANSSTREFGLGRKHPSVDAFKKEFKTLKPCVHSSDAHSFDSMFEPDEQRYTWIKADPTWRGLRQLLHEPDDRVFIGERPDSLRSLPLRATKVIERVHIGRTASATTSDTWFANDLGFTGQLVAVIGNKGSGKSALADVVGLLGSTRNFGAFSFLRADRFRNPRHGIARQFQASLTWVDGTVEGPQTLDRDPDPSAAEKVKYIPQGYLEEICNEISAGKKTQFYSELEAVIFSHVPSSERLGENTLEGLLDRLGGEITRAAEMRANQIRDINRQLSRICERLSDGNQRAIANLLAERRRELAAHDAAKPLALVPPEEDPNALVAATAVATDLTAANAALLEIADELARLQEEDRTLALRKAKAANLAAAVRNAVDEFATSLASLRDDFVALGIEANAVASTIVDMGPLENIVRGADERRAIIASALDPQEPGSQAHIREALASEAELLTAQLSEPQRRYQEYQAALIEWETRRREIVGTVDAAGTVAHAEGQLQELATLPQKRRILERKRLALALELYDEKERLRLQYEKYHAAVQRFLTSHPIARSEGFALTFRAAIVESGFADSLMNLIDQRRVGPFAGADEGRQRIAAMIAGADWSSRLGVVRFIWKTLRAMAASDGREYRIDDQLRSGASIDELWNLLYSLDYVRPIYQLTWGTKGLDELSPGERGNLLLIFYLLVDREVVPLVIDQPEENLDNQTIVKTLVPCMKDAKKRRQIILVTHNPNLAVVCDAEQVVYAELRKSAGNEIYYESGSIEDPRINQRIIDVLEGTKPAFEQRDARYHV